MAKKNIETDLPEVVGGEKKNPLHEALCEEIKAMAFSMAVPLGMEGEVFTPPVDTHLRGKVLIDKRQTAALGPDAPMRTDGRLEIEIVCRAGIGMSTALAVAGQVERHLCRGNTISFTGGEAVLGTHRHVKDETNKADRVRHTVSISFYAFERS